jgi:hypothetical protein
MCIHSPATCASHNDSSANCCTWLKFFISSTHHSCSAILSLVDLWQVTTLLSWVFFVIVDCHFVSMSHPCTRSLSDFCWLFAFVFSLGCVYLYSHLPCTFNGWVSILDFYLHGFSFFLLWMN